MCAGYPHIVAIRVVVADDSYLIRIGLRGLIDPQPDLELVGECDDLPSLMKTIERDSPDVVVTDIRMPPTNTDEGLRAAAEVRTTSPGVGVVVLSNYDEPDYALALLEGGSDRRAYLLKERVADVGHIVETIRTVAAGGSVIDPKVVDSLVRARGSSARSPLGRLTERELEVLGLMAQGKNNAGIADVLYLSERGVEKHINSIFAKLDLAGQADVHRRVAAVLLFLADR